MVFTSFESLRTTIRVCDAGGYPAGWIAIRALVVVDLERRFMHIPDGCNILKLVLVGVRVYNMCS